VKSKSDEDSEDKGEENEDKGEENEDKGEESNVGQPQYVKKRNHWWKRHVDKALHHDVHHFIKQGLHKKDLHPELRQKIKKWWNDSEEDDAEDIKKMKHIFSRARSSAGK
jgi:hypothetical protein